MLGWYPASQQRTSGIPFWETGQPVSCCLLRQEPGICFYIFILSACPPALRTLPLASPVGQVQLPQLAILPIHLALAAVESESILATFFELSASA
jgi:hypothetical protein